MLTGEVYSQKVKDSKYVVGNHQKAKMCTHSFKIIFTTGHADLLVQIRVSAVFNLVTTSVLHFLWFFGLDYLRSFEYSMKCHVVFIRRLNRIIFYCESIFSLVR